MLIVFIAVASWSMKSATCQADFGLDIKQSQIAIHLLEVTGSLALDRAWSAAIFVETWIVGTESMQSQLNTYVMS